MIVFSKALHAFTLRLETLTKELLQEMKLEVGRTRFTYKKNSYPIHIVTFESKTKVGHFSPKNFQIGINKRLMFESKTKTIKDILRHELAHFIAYLEYGDEGLGHGAYFKSICEKYHFESTVSDTSINLEESFTNLEGDLEAERVLTKVKNLLKLAESSNPHESKLASLKANNLLLKYNLEHIEDEFDADKEYYITSLLTQKRKDAKITAIYEIIKNFMVRPILAYSKDDVSLEAMGTKLNLELADYVTSFLERELDRLWMIEKKLNPNLKGLLAKNSFFRGLARGYDEKMQEMRSQNKNALIKLEKELELNSKLYYRKLGHSLSSATLHDQAYSKGLTRGNNLNINKSINHKQKNIFLLGRT